MIPIIMPVIQVTVPSPVTTQATPGPTAVMIPLIIAGARRQAGPPLQVAAAIFLAVALMVYQAGILPWLDRRIEWILHCGTTGAGAAEASCDDRPMTTLVTEFSPAAPSRSDGPGRWCNQVSRHSALRLLLILLSFSLASNPCFTTSAPPLCSICWLLCFTNDWSRIFEIIRAICAEGADGICSLMFVFTSDGILHAGESVWPRRCLLCDVRLLWGVRSCYQLLLRLT